MTCTICNLTCYPAHKLACQLLYVGLGLFGALLLLICFRCCCWTRTRLLQDNYEIVMSSPLPARVRGVDTPSWATRGREPFAGIYV